MNQPSSVREGPHSVSRVLTADSLVTDATLDARDLQDFAQFVQANKAALETQLDIPIRADVAKKPVQQLGTILRLLGLPLTERKAIVVSGQKIRRYGIDDDERMEMERVIEARKRIRGWQFMTGHYGPRMDPFADDESEDFDA